MASEAELKKAREEKKKVLESYGINPYPSTTNVTHTNDQVAETFSDLEKSGETVTLAGRVMSIRGQGKIFFVDLEDGTQRFQVVVRADSSPKYTNHDELDGLQVFKEAVDGGDFIEATGVLFTTKAGQPSLDVQSWRMLTKALLPIPDSFYGLKDDDTRYRKRYLDLLLNPEKRELFMKKAHFWSVAQRFMAEHDFLSVETPTLEVTTGGAEARPFKTYHNDFDMDVFLRISVGELWQKRLMAAGFPRTYEIGRVFRNEGSSPEHLQEFTNLECYAAYMNLEQGMQLVQDLYRALASEVFGTTQFTAQGHTFDLADEWQHIDYVSRVQEKTGINVLEATEADMREKLEELGVKYEGANRERLTDSLWKYCRKSIAGPAFLINHPKLVAPLSKSLPENENQTEMFQVILAGSEVGRAHAELNDPEEQQKRLDTQQDLIDRGDDEAMMKDDEFVEMLEHGMPPTFGFGFGERLFAFFAGETIRETQLFPLMRPKDE